MTGARRNAQRPLLFHSLEGKKFEYVPPVKGSGAGSGDARARGGVWRSLQ